MSAFSFENQVFRDFAFHGTIVCLKMGAMSFMTILHRFRTTTFANYEDYVGKKPKELRANDRVERARRNHLNDLENIPLYILLGLFYVATNPDPSQALLHFRIFTASKLLHTLAYQLPLPQPSRAGTWFVGVGVCVSMGVRILRHLS